MAGARQEQAPPVGINVQSEVVGSQVTPPRHWSPFAATAEMLHGRPTAGSSTQLPLVASQ
ncbi:MAG TPA: hypothetical protein VHO06_25500 [Polyangia bacterium]|nr:hypothetical protein [Polyangia bacterium]